MSEMKLIVGLGNPGAKYRLSRHNVGFDLVDRLGRCWSVELKQHRFQGWYGSGRAGSQQVKLLKPETFMNRSGVCVAEAVRFYRVPLNDLLVLVDDMALELGDLRLRRGGSAGGHNGLEDIIARLGTDEFARLRVGIGPAPTGEAVNYVLSTFRPEERQIIETVLERAARAVETWVKFGIDEAMNQHNKRIEPGEKNIS